MADNRTAKPSRRGRHAPAGRAKKSTARASAKGGALPSAAIPSAVAERGDGGLLLGAPTEMAAGVGERGAEDGPLSLDRIVPAAIGRATFSVSPISLALAYLDWAFHLAISSGKQQALVEKALRKAVRFAVHAAHTTAAPGTSACIEPLPQDHRFSDPAWQQPPFRFTYQWFLLIQQWWHNATVGVHGVSHHHEEVVSFVARQLLDMTSPSNFIWTNPQLLKCTLEQGGANLVRGAVNAVEDWERAIAGRPPVGSEAFQPGREVAVTPGRVVYRNRLMELIQYAPEKPKTYAEPILIVPAWIMKYYILDLSPGNSLVRYLVERGHTVFMISWHNPNAGDRDLGIEDYLRLGILEAIHAIQTIVPGRPINAAGYCIGGTLLSIAAALLARGQRRPLNTVTLFAAQVDFTEAGELTLFVDESQLAHLDDVMWNQGYLDTRQMAGAFQLLRSNDLIWSRLIHDYLMGEREPINDLMAWNADATRMPYRMHSEYLHRFFLHNDLVEGRYEVAGRPVALTDIRAPVFAVATEWDHVAPWRSVYKLNFLLDTEVTFLLTSGGHNAGIVSEPGHAGRHFRVARRAATERHIDPETWYASNPPIAGSWWPAWTEWLETHSKGQVPAPKLGAPQAGYRHLGPAPGSYVHEA